MDKSEFCYSHLDEIKRKLKIAISERNAFSLVRAGDGEGAFLGYPSLSSKQNCEKFLKIWWGSTDFDFACLDKLRAEVESAIKQADILGIPDPNHPTWENMRIVFQYLNAKGLISKDRTFSNQLVAQNLYRDGFLARIVEEQDEIDLISPHPELPDIIYRSLGTRVNQTLIAGEFKFFHGRSHFPDEYHSISSTLTSAPGRICLIAAGICGKVYANVVRSHGGIGLDLGSVLDHWSGRQTRDVHKKWTATIS